VRIHRRGWCVAEVDRRAAPTSFRRLSRLARRNHAMDVVRILIAILLPPLGVFLQVGIGLHFWLNILLTILGYIPGIIHAIWVITRK
jgi:uncharacterized membrane protein YqaE (UPF0057 family)